jgi:hypothetical protein
VRLFKREPPSLPVEAWPRTLAALEHMTEAEIRAAHDALVVDHGLAAPLGTDFYRDELNRRAQARLERASFIVAAASCVAAMLALIAAVLALVA